MRKLSSVQKYVMNHLNIGGRIAFRQGVHGLPDSYELQGNYHNRHCDFLVNPATVRALLRANLIEYIGHYDGTCDGYYKATGVGDE